jgi:hypothetical protein
MLLTVLPSDSNMLAFCVFKVNFTFRNQSLSLQANLRDAECGTRLALSVSGKNNNKPVLLHFFLPLQRFIIASWILKLKLLGGDVSFGEAVYWLPSETIHRSSFLDILVFATNC